MAERRFILLSLLSILYLSLSAQGEIGSWSDRLSYSSSFAIAAGGGKIYSSAGASVLVRDARSGSSDRLSKVNGLNEALISTLGWCEDEQTLIVAYKNAEIDLVRKGVVTNIPDIRNKYIPGLKEIRRITVTGNRALLATSFGIVVTDIKGKYIADTWRPGPDGNPNYVYSIAVISGRVYAATGRGVYSAPMTATGLSYFGNWERLEGLSSPDARYDNIASAGNVLFISKPAETGSDSLFSIIPGQSSALILTRPAGAIRSADPYPGGVAISLPSSLQIINADGTVGREITGYGFSSPNPAQSTYYDNRLWIADASAGLIWSSGLTDFTSVTLPGPYTNNVADIFFSEGRGFMTGGTVDNAWGNVYRPFQLFISEGNQWNSIILYEPADRDAMRVVSDPADKDHWFVSSWGNGIYEFSDGALVKTHNQYNSPLSSIIPGENYTRICGMAFDSRGNLWMSQSGVPGILKALKPDGTWIIPPLSGSVQAAGDMLIDANGFIWTLLPRGNGLLVYDPAGTPDAVSDDRYTTLQVEDTEGHVMSNLFSIASDRQGNVWVGTDQGPLVYYNPSSAFSGNMRATRIKIPRNDGSGLADYLLGTETITSIASDGAGRKWFGTMSSGAYLVSEDGKQEILHFTEANSPLLSDNIVKVNLNGITGEVWFGTSAGTVSFRSDATTGGSDFAGMYAFPNPVREDFEGVVTVTGLMDDTSVKITDVRGNLVYETVSMGGQATWNLKNYRSDRVATGVYLVFCSNSDGSVSAVTKILVIR